MHTSVLPPPTDWIEKTFQGKCLVKKQSREWGIEETAPPYKKEKQKQKQKTEVAHPTRVQRDIAKHDLHIQREEESW